jgi:hypothetical protein
VPQDLPVWKESSIDLQVGICRPRSALQTNGGPAVASIAKAVEREQQNQPPFGTAVAFFKIDYQGVGTYLGRTGESVRFGRRGSRVVHAAATAGIAALDSPYFENADTEGLKQETKASASLGFHGKCAIHPAQVAVINEVLTPTAQQVAKAREVLVVNRQGVGSLDGQMVDEAFARKPRLVLERAGITTEE